MREKYFVSEELNGSSRIHKLAIVWTIFLGILQTKSKTILQNVDSMFPYIVLQLKLQRKFFDQLYLILVEQKWLNSVVFLNELPPFGIIVIPGHSNLIIQRLNTRLS